MIIRLVGDNWVSADNLVCAVVDAEPVAKALVAIMKKLKIAKIAEYTLYLCNGGKPDFSRVASRDSTWKELGVAQGHCIYVSKKAPSPDATSENSVTVPPSVPADETLSKSTDDVLDQPGVVAAVASPPPPQPSASEDVSAVAGGSQPPEPPPLPPPVRKTPAAPSCGAAAVPAKLPPPPPMPKRPVAVPISPPPPPPTSQQAPVTSSLETALPSSTAEPLRPEVEVVAQLHDEPAPSPATIVPVGASAGCDNVASVLVFPVPAPPPPPPTTSTSVDAPATNAHVAPTPAHPALPYANERSATDQEEGSSTARTQERQKNETAAAEDLMRHTSLPTPTRAPERRAAPKEPSAVPAAVAKSRAREAAVQEEESAPPTARSVSTVTVPRPIAAADPSSTPLVRHEDVDRLPLLAPPHRDFDASSGDRTPWRHDPRLIQSLSTIAEGVESLSRRVSNLEVSSSSASKRERSALYDEPSPTGRVDETSSSHVFKSRESVASDAVDLLAFVRLQREGLEQRRQRMEEERMRWEQRRARGYVSNSQTANLYRIQ